MWSTNDIYTVLQNILLFISVCFKIFDRDKDGLLNRSEIATMLQSMVEIRNQTLPPSERIRPEGIFYVGKNKFLSEMAIFILQW